MKTIRKTLVMFSLLLFSAGSVQSAQTRQYPAADFPFRHSDFDYKVAWKTTGANNAVVIDGILKNVRYESITSIEVTLFLVGTDGKIRARTSTSPFPQQSRMDEIVPFGAKLQNVSIKRGDTLKFAIHYAGSDGRDGQDWTSTFAVDALTGAVLHKDNLKSEEW